MKCLEIKHSVDVCVKVDVKLIYRKPVSEDLQKALTRNEAMLKAAYLGTRHETNIADEIRQALLKEELGV
jgi:hypothetical protein